MALDYPEQVKSCTFLDIAPTLAMYNMTNMEFAKKYYHWFFLIQPSPMPEKLISAEPNVFFKHIFQSWSKTPGAISEPLMEEYIRYFSRTDIIHSSCEDYRAGASIDLEHDEQDLHVKIKQPVQVLWGSKGTVGQLYDVLKLWRERAENVNGQAITCGHFLPEEAPDETYQALIQFLGE